MHVIELTYTLRSGGRGRLHCTARHTCDAVLMALDFWGEALRSCSARRVR